MGEVAYVRYNNKYYAIGDHAEFNNSDLPDNQKIYNMVSGDFRIWEITSDENRDILFCDAGYVIVRETKEGFADAAIYFEIYDRGECILSIESDEE